jgi:hypothetical protein
MKGESARQNLWGRPTFWNWLRSEAELISTDGCSRVSGAKIDCCYLHDLMFYHGSDPHEAYRLYRIGRLEPWTDAHRITRAEADRHLRRCLCNRSVLGHWSPMAWWRWLAVRLFAGGAWAAHRQRDAHVEPA